MTHFNQSDLVNFLSIFIICLKVLKKHYVAGGNTHTWTDAGREFDTGTHYVGTSIADKRSKSKFVFFFEPNLFFVSFLFSFHILKPLLERSWILFRMASRNSV